MQLPAMNGYNFNYRCAPASTGDRFLPTPTKRKVIPPNPWIIERHRTHGYRGPSALHYFPPKVNVKYMRGTINGKVGRAAEPCRMEEHPGIGTKHLSQTRNEQLMTGIAQCSYHPLFVTVVLPLLSLHRQPGSRSV